MRFSVCRSLTSAIFSRFRRGRLAALSKLYTVASSSLLSQATIQRCQKGAYEGTRKRNRIANCSTFRIY